MKRELLFALKEQEKLGWSVGRTRSGKVKNVVGEISAKRKSNVLSLPGGSSVKRFTRSSIKVLDNSVDEPVVGDGRTRSGKVENVVREISAKRKSNVLSPPGGSSVKRFTRSSIKVLDNSVDEPVVRDGASEGVAGGEGLRDVGGEQEKCEVMSEVKREEVGKSVVGTPGLEVGNVDSCSNIGADKTAVSWKREGVLTPGVMRVKRFTRSSLILTGDSVDEALPNSRKTSDVHESEGVELDGSVKPEKSSEVGIVDSTESVMDRKKELTSVRIGFVKRFTRSSLDALVAVDRSSIFVSGAAACKKLEESPPTSLNANLTLETASSKISKQAKNTKSGKTRSSEHVLHEVITLRTALTNDMKRKSMKKASLRLDSSSFKACCSKSKLRSVWKNKKRMAPARQYLKPRKKAMKWSFTHNSGHKITHKDLGVHKVVFEEGGLPDGTELGYFVRGEKLLEGYKKDDGIVCKCCDSKVSPSNFEAHAGCAKRRKPYHHIFTSNGVSLHEFAVDIRKACKNSSDNNDDLCIICHDGGELLCCDLCSRACHLECVSLTSIPRGKWYCNYCTTMFARNKAVTHNANAIAAGRVFGGNPIEQINNRCIRIVNMVDADVTACALCSSCEYSKSGFNDRTIIICDQCELEFHVGCLRTQKMSDLKDLPKEKWFCRNSCKTVHMSLRKLVNRGEVELSEAVLGPVKSKRQGQGPNVSANLNIKWRLLKGELASTETGPLLSKAVAIFRESFAPIKDAIGKDLLPCIVYGKKTKGFEYEGIYCAVLTINSAVVSAAIFRVFGQNVAELPMVATSKEHQGQGYFQVLLSCIERLLSSLKVKRLVLPSAEESKAIWTENFGFNEIPSKEVEQLKKRHWPIVKFQGTTMLERSVPSSDKIHANLQNSQGIIRNFSLSITYFLLNGRNPRSHFDVQPVSSDYMTSYCVCITGLSF